jgi:hypothetical protein
VTLPEPNALPCYPKTRCNFVFGICNRFSVDGNLEAIRRGVQGSGQADLRVEPRMSLTALLTISRCDVSTVVNVLQQPYQSCTSFVNKSSESPDLWGTLYTEQPSYTGFWWLRFWAGISHSIDPRVDSASRRCSVLTGRACDQIHCLERDLEIVSAKTCGACARA